MQKRSNKKDYRQLYYKEMKRRVKEKRRRKSIEHDMAQQETERGCNRGWVHVPTNLDGEPDGGFQNEVHLRRPEQKGKHVEVPRVELVVK